jgi:sphingolipid delta-4 desaturase
MSWTKLFFRFLFDKEISLFSRVVRKERGKVSLTDESRPDMDLVRANGANGANANTNASARAVHS